MQSTSSRPVHAPWRDTTWDSPRAPGLPSTAARHYGLAWLWLLHGFSLLHDDIMDGGHTRRGRAAAWVVYGVPAALLTGDALLTLALGVLANSGSAASMGVCVRMMSALVRGQGND